MKTLSKFLILLGVILFAFGVFLIWQRSTPAHLSFNINNVPAARVTFPDTRYPVRLVITDLSIDLPIYPASIHNGNWEATAQGVSYLVASARPGNIGNSIFYGHNWRSLLGSLTSAKKGQEVKVIFSDGDQRKFLIDSTQVVTPDETNVLSQTKDHRITIYTCTGFLDSKRFVAIAIGQ